MSLQLYEIDSSRMPLTLGSALRVPSYAYKNWGVYGGNWLREESDRQYELEWKGGSPKQMQNVVKAITESGLGNYSQMLRDANASVVSEILKKSEEKINYLELGAGVSTVNLYRKMINDGIDVEKMFSTLVEPSEERIVDTANELYGMGLKDSDFNIIVARDVDIPIFVDTKSQDIVSYVAVLHHHAFIDTPLTCVYNALKKDGMLIVADWHNAMWEHPNRVYEFLRDDFDWPVKEEDLKRFSDAYPKSMEPAPELLLLDAGSNRNIKKFWRSWAEIRKNEIDENKFNPEDDIWLLEAHRPVEKQNEVIQDIGYKLDTPRISELQKENPKRLIDDTGILYVTLAQKP
ncbi:class I SAM-dependent methyltransferase [archaeon]|nr:class I SAM-dependent methyltransferase [archaeon]